MIYLKNITDAQVAFIPRSLRDVVGQLVFTAWNTTDLSEAVRTDVADLETSDLYYRISIAFPEVIPVGEYRYALTDDTGIISQGLMMVGEFSSPAEYNKTIVYEQYE